MRGRGLRCGRDDRSASAAVEVRIVETRTDETAATCAGFLERAAAHFASYGITRIERVMTDKRSPTSRLSPT